MLQKTVVCMRLLLTNKSYIRLSTSSSVRRTVLNQLNHQLSHSLPCGFPYVLIFYAIICRCTSHLSTFSTVPRSLFVFIRGRVDWWFDWTTSTNNSGVLWCELSWPIPLFLYLFFFNLLWFFAGGIRNSVLDIYFTMYSKWRLLGCDTRCRDVDALFRE